jgi:predicted deacylase
MPKKIRLGTAVSRPGTIQYGQWDAFTHPTGTVEFLPVIIAQGREDGPCLWLTAGIHGPEHTGPVVLYNLLTQQLVEHMKGTIVAIPALSPAGLRTMAYEPHHELKNPNRLWPDGKLPPHYRDPEAPSPSPLEIAYDRLFREMIKTADFLIDYHNAWIGSLSFSFRDRVLYHAKGPDAVKNRLKAEKLAQTQEAMLRAYGHTIVTEFPPSKYIKEDLHRSTSGAALLLGHIPSFTVELGTGDVPDPNIVRAAICGTRNVMRWAGMLGRSMEQIEGIKLVEPRFPVRHSETVRMTQGCVILHLVDAGDSVEVGQPIAEIRDIWGRPIGEGLIYSPYDGFVIGRNHGIYYYPGQEIIILAIRDNDPIVAPYPDDYYEDLTEEQMLFYTEAPRLKGKSHDVV